MSLFKSETLGEQLDREAKEKASLKAKLKAERLAKEKGGIAWGVGEVNPENQTQILIEQNECIIQLLGVLCSGQNTVSGVASVAVMDMYRKRLNEIENQ